MSDTPKNEAAELGRVLSGKGKGGAGPAATTTDVAPEGIFSKITKFLQRGGEDLQKPDFGGMVKLSEGGHGIFESNAPGISGQPGGFTSGAQGSAESGGGSTGGSDSGSSDYRTNKKEVGSSGQQASEIESAEKAGHFQRMTNEKKGKDEGKGWQR
jgi:hypothetical protein